MLFLALKIRFQAKFRNRSKPKSKHRNKLRSHIRNKANIRVLKEKRAGKMMRTIDPVTSLYDAA